MRISPISNTQKSLNFGRALNPEELKTAAQTTQSAREVLGFQNGKSVLYIPQERFPKEVSEGNVSGVKKFFQTVRDLFGINSVEIAPEVDPKYAAAASEAGLGRIKLLDTLDADDVVEEVKTALKSSEGLRIANADSLSDEQLEAIESYIKSTDGAKSVFYEVANNDSIFDWGNSAVKDKFKGKTVVGSSRYANNDGGLWGVRKFFTDRMKMPQGDFIFGVRKSGEESLMDQIANADQFNKGVQYYSSTYDIPQDAFTPEIFAQTKNVDIASSKNVYRNLDDIILGEKLDTVLDFEPRYFSALQEGKAENPFDALVKVFRDWKFDKDNGGIIQKLEDFRHALYSGGATTVEEAKGLAQEAIEASYKDKSNPIFAPERAKIEAQRIAEQLEATKSKIKPTGESVFNDLMDFGRKHKVAVISVAATAIGAWALGTLYSLGKEIGAKEEKSKPIAQER